MKFYLFLAVSLFSYPVLACHSAVDLWAANAEPRTFVRAETEVAGFNIDSTQGNYVTTFLRADYAPWAPLGVTVQLPFHVLNVNNQTQTGLGDLSAMLRLRVLNGSQGALSLGVAAEAPTGNKDAGMSSGHVELAPLIVGMYRVKAFVLHSMVSEQISLESDSSSHHHEGNEDASHHDVNYVAPHSSHELRYNAGVAYNADAPWFVDLVLSGITVLAKEERGETFLHIDPQAGIVVAEKLRLIAGVQIPITEEKRFDWKTTLAAQWMF